MRILLDTHTFLWFFNDASRLRPEVARIIELESTNPFVSIASIWEISIKSSIGKLDVPASFASIPDILFVNEISVLPIDLDHTLKHNQHPFHHRDPFDRMLAAQALAEKIDLISADPVFDKYFEGSEVIW